MKLIKADFTPAEFRWINREAENPFPPVVAEHEGKAYILSGFEKPAESFFHAGVLSLDELFELSLKIHGEPDPADLGRMIEIGESFGRKYREINVISVRVKGVRNAESLKILSRSPQSFLEYVKTKQPSMKTVGMYAALPESHKEFLHKYISSQPSVSAFRTAVETLTDYADRDINPDDAMLTKKLETERRETRTEFEAEFRRLGRILGGDISSQSGFETEEVTVSFTASSYEEYLKKCAELYDSRENAAELFRFLKENDIY